MDIEERMAKAETDVAVLKEVQRLLLHEMGELRGTMERGFAEVRAALAEERVALAEERAERQREFRWMFSALLAILALVLGMVARMAGLL